MIHDHYVFSVDMKSEEVKLLVESPYSFYLTGSHFFECSHADSDVDFMVQSGEEVERWLRDHGFIKDVLDYAPQRGLLTEKVLQRGNVQVQLTSNLALKRRVRDFIKLTAAEWHRAADRDQRMWMWDTCARVLDPETYCPSFLF